MIFTLYQKCYHYDGLIKWDICYLSLVFVCLPNHQKIEYLVWMPKWLLLKTCLRRDTKVVSERRQFWIVMHEVNINKWEYNTIDLHNWIDDVTLTSLWSVLLIHNKWEKKKPRWYNKRWMKPCITNSKKKYINKNDD